MVSALAGAIFLCGCVEFHGCHTVKPLLVSSGVVEMNILFNCIHQILLVSELPQIVHFRFQDSPEALHGAVVDTPANPGHALDHIRLVQFCTEHFACVLVTTVTMQ